MYGNDARERWEDGLENGWEDRRMHGWADRWVDSGNTWRYQYMGGWMRWGMHACGGCSSWGGEAHLEVFKGLSPLQGLEGVLVIDPGGHGAQHQAQPPREAARVVLTQVELNAVQCSLHCCAGEPARLQLLQLAQD